ncbi:hypothetical protein SAMN05421823_11097 [Catalinimonas alkaloidigena]|uniref:Ezrin/radixin/moesin family protein n=1 Tax=Catalinimonas alkaloidigena TaxID=1075417 RepID=A0A1G9QAF2_9BACT|nr:Ezrin/radixin/moesin family protein [Catalinimonas alkaloidigena]SDM07913.1 hypothetical protein SAMN05421823_11097 [Catalinimonas alkaloidigena]
MKKVVLILGLIVMAGNVNDAFAQKSKKSDKKEAKEWAKKQKSMDPLEFKELMEERDKAVSDTEKLRSSVMQLQKQLDQATVENSNLKGQLAESKAKALATPPSTERKAAAQHGVAPVDGLVFKVQIGAFKNKNLSKYFENHPNFGGEQDSDGTQRVTLGQFAEYWEADTFKKYLREMGVKDAWIVAYRNGDRIAMQEALEAAGPAPAAKKAPKPQISTVPDEGSGW